MRFTIEVQLVNEIIIEQSKFMTTKKELKKIMD